jgi:hypothetical protein
MCFTSRPWPSPRSEIDAGIARCERIGATAKAERLRRWLAAVEHFYAGRVLPFGIEEEALDSFWRSIRP